MKNIFKEIILTYQNKEYQDIIKRDLEIDFSLNKIISIVWPRRSWKSSYLFSIIKELREKWVNKTNFLYINFEDERLEITSKDLWLIIESYRELYPEININNCYFFFDEIQNIIGWEKFIRRINDEWLKNIFITGSNSKLLSKEIATSLRWRSISYEILPLDFKEYFRFKNITIESIYKKEDKAIILKEFDNYLKWWGFPELINYKEESKILTYQEYFDTMIYNDIIERYKINDISLLKTFIKKLLQTTTKEFSINKIWNELKSMWYKFDKNILYDYIDYLENIYFWKVINKFDFSLKKQFLSKKFYTIDNGFLNSLTFSFSDNYWKLLENLVYLYLYKNFWENVYFVKNGVDVDFIIYGKEKFIYQVCYDLNKENRERELWSLEKAIDIYKAKKWYLITREQFENVSDKIEVKPYYNLFFY